MSHRFVVMIALGLFLVVGTAACAGAETDEGLTTEVGATEPAADEGMRAHFLGDVDVARVDSTIPSPDQRVAPESDRSGRRAGSFGNGGPSNLRPLPAYVAPNADCVKCR
jgi:hypothetical protein